PTWEWERNSGGMRPELTLRYRFMDDELPAFRCTAGSWSNAGGCPKHPPAFVVARDFPHSSVAEPAWRVVRPVRSGSRVRVSTRGSIGALEEMAG
ncbi:MAG: hypothetical protein NDJ92_15245, partial [Thermoanaerobaculia bacterium]|nr:hypothetical protein [Thermoanaerobaculia bacterium]